MWYIIKKKDQKRGKDDDMDKGGIITGHSSHLWSQMNNSLPVTHSI